MSKKNNKKIEQYNVATMENLNEQEEFNQDEELEMPKNAKNTLKRLILSIRDEYKRLAIVLVSVIFYTVLTIVAPLYSAKIIDLLWNAIQSAMANGTTFSITWEQGGLEICILLAIYVAAGLLYLLQKFMMTSFSERLSFKLRQEISNKINLLPLSYYDNHKPG